MSKIHISEHFNFKKILRFTFAPICMMIFMSIYSIVDGFFLSNYASKEAFTAVNLIFPVIMVIAALGFMFGTGGSAFIGALLGKKEDDKARKTFSMVIYSSLIIGIFFSICFYFLIEPIVKAMVSVNEETSPETIKHAITYGKIMIVGEIFYILQNVFQSFFSTAEKPGIGFAFTLAAGLTNILFDFIFIGILSLGVVGAAIASIMGMMVASIGPFVYFSLNKRNNIYLTKFKFCIKDLLTIIANGSSEFLSNISTSIVSIIFNIQLLKYLGEPGVSAYGIIMYVSFVFAAIFIGYSIGVSPIISYNYGSKNKKELSSLYKKSFIFMLVVGASMVLLSEVLSSPFSSLFASGSLELEKLATKAMRIYSFCYIFMGFSMFGSSSFTALNNGLISAIISTSRTLIFQSISIFVLPLILGVDGLWWSMVFAEFWVFILAIIFWLANKNKYGYFDFKEVNDLSNK